MEGTRREAMVTAGGRAGDAKQKNENEKYQKPNVKRLSMEGNKCLENFSHIWAMWVEN